MKLNKVFKTQTKKERNKIYKERYEDTLDLIESYLSENINLEIDIIQFGKKNYKYALKIMSYLKGKEIPTSLNNLEYGYTIIIFNDKSYQRQVKIKKIIERKYVKGSK